MEALVLAGLIGAGYILSDNDKNKNPIMTPRNKELTVPNGTNVYNSEHYNETDNLVRSLAKKNFESSQRPNSEVINHQKVNIPLNMQEGGSTNRVENYDNFVYSNSSGGYVDKTEFMSNDQGVNMTPFFKGAGHRNINFDDNRTLEAMSGLGSAFQQSKKEQPNMFERQKQNIHGNYFGEGMGDKNRYVDGKSRKNELPFQQQQVRKIDEKDSLTREIGKLIADKSQIDNLRTLNNQKLVNKGKVLSGQSIVKSRGKLGMTFQHNPDKFYLNTEDRWLKTTGANIAASKRPEQIIPDTNRQVYNKQEMGIASGQNIGHEKRQLFRKPMKQQLGTDTERNMGIETPQIGTDIHIKGYRSVPNEREVTEQRDYTGNVSADYKESTIGILDPIRQTIKETTINSKQNGHMSNSVINTMMGLQDGAKVTKKQTTIDSLNNGFIKGGFEKRSSSYETPENTTKDSTLYEYSGNMGGHNHGQMDKENYKNAETNATRETIMVGRAPTQNSVKISNGGDTVAIDIKKIEDDYMNHRLNGVDQVYQKIPTQELNLRDVTTTKDRLDDISISSGMGGELDRIDTALLDPFKNNPYTQSLSSFAY